MNEISYNDELRILQIFIFVSLATSSVYIGDPGCVELLKMMLIRPNIGIKYAYHLFLGLNYTPTQLVGIESTYGFLDGTADTTVSV